MQKMNNAVTIYAFLHIVMHFYCIVVCIFDGFLKKHFSRPALRAGAGRGAGSVFSKIHQTFIKKCIYVNRIIQCRRGYFVLFLRPDTIVQVVFP